jgi:TonB family protein
VQDKLQGQVIVKMVVSETGDVESTEVVSGNPVLDSAAVGAAKKWKFRSFIKNGKAVRASVKLPFDFAFSDEVSDISPKGVSAGGVPAAPERVHVPPGLTQGMVIHKVQPTYPPQSLLASIKGG